MKTNPFFFFPWDIYFYSLILIIIIKFKKQDGKESNETVEREWEDPLKWRERRSVLNRGRK